MLYVFWEKLLYLYLDLGASNIGDTLKKIPFKLFKELLDLDFFIPKSEQISTPLYPAPAPTNNPGANPNNSSNNMDQFNFLNFSQHPKSKFSFETFSNLMPMMSQTGASFLNPMNPSINNDQLESDSQASLSFLKKSRPSRRDQHGQQRVNLLSADSLGSSDPLRSLKSNKKTIQTTDTESDYNEIKLTQAVNLALLIILGNIKPEDPDICFKNPPEQVKRETRFRDFIQYCEKVGYIAFVRLTFVSHQTVKEYKLNTEEDFFRRERPYTSEKFHKRWATISNELIYFAATTFIEHGLRVISFYVWLNQFMDDQRAFFINQVVKIKMAKAKRMAEVKMQLEKEKGERKGQEVVVEVAEKAKKGVRKAQEC